MKKFKVKFTGREVGAIGVFSHFELIIEAPDEDAARLKIYDTHEHLHFGVAIEEIKQPEQT